MSTWLGSFTKSQFDRLADFATKQAGDIDARIQHLTAEQFRIGVISLKYDKGTVVAYKGDSDTSYIGKLVMAYQVLGGDPYHDLQIRQKDTQPLFLLRGDETSSPKRMSNGRVVGTEALADAPSAVLVQRLKGWMSESMRYKRESLEHKIRRAMDYSDQLGDEIKLLRLVKQGKEVTGSLENVLEEIRLLIQDRNYKAIADDQGKDPNGLMAYAPYLGLEPGPNRPSTEYGRTLDGYAIPESEG